MDECEDWEAALSPAVGRIKHLREGNARRHKQAIAFPSLGLLIGRVFVEVKVADQRSLIRIKRGQVEKLDVLGLVRTDSDHFIVDYALNVLV